MEKYSDIYNKQLESTKAIQRMIMDHIVAVFKVGNLEPLWIGNMVYFFFEINGVEVPVYAYFNDYQTGDFNWLPIYDEDNTGEFGWSDFSECCRIFDEIEKHFNGAPKQGIVVGM